VPSAEVTAAERDRETSSSPAVNGSVRGAETRAMPVVASSAPLDGAPEAPPARRRWWQRGPRPRIEWRSFSGWFALAWMLDLYWIVRLVAHGPPMDEGLPKKWLGEVGGASFVALLLAFLLPISLLDDSSHYPRAWWVAWLWPVVMVLMLFADAIVIGYAVTKLMPLVSLLKKH
jgi:hypothetical protein